ncbi:hypothetical protein PR048_023889 [Dryococelus australis]|uniref:Uncharacterized protein n=1 Tax=Dryococelus australis TaxID=614101 RepID=A0ABQ9GVD3_9NEOP|nr:hypothetical protein PR048_023889 [Dryococelus australis]
MKSMNAVAAPPFFELPQNLVPALYRCILPKPAAYTRACCTHGGISLWSGSRDTKVKPIMKDKDRGSSGKKLKEIRQGIGFTWYTGGRQDVATPLHTTSMVARRRRTPCSHATRQQQQWRQRAAAVRAHLPAVPGDVTVGARSAQVIETALGELRHTSPAVASTLLARGIRIARPRVIMRIYLNWRDIVSPNYVIYRYSSLMQGVAVTNRVRFPVGPPRFPHVAIVPDSAVSRLVSSVISRFSHPYIPMMLHIHLASLSSVKSSQKFSTPLSQSLKYSSLQSRLILH